MFLLHRTSGLLRSGALKYEDKPLWYDIYAAFPPHLEPRYDRPAPNVTVKQIFYEEDKIRAKYHKLTKTIGSTNLFDTKHRTQTQHFIDTYNHIRNQGALDETQIFESAVDVLKDKLSQEYDNQPKEYVGLLNSFSEAKTSATTATPNIDIKNIFKD